MSNQEFSNKKPNKLNDEFGSKEQKNIKNNDSFQEELQENIFDKTEHKQEKSVDIKTDNLKKDLDSEENKQNNEQNNDDKILEQDTKEETVKNNFNDNLDKESPNGKHKNSNEKDSKLKYELEKLKVLYSNSQIECIKLKQMLENERKQLIVKLEEKSKAAQLQVDQKLSHLELTKKEEIIKIKENLASDIINAFIDPILLFESSVKNAPKDNPAISSYLQGYNMIINMFNEKLDSLGVQQIDVNVGDEFNEKFMSAFDVEECDGMEPNKVIRVVNKGFVLNKKIIKYVSVVVSK